MENVKMINWETTTEDQQNNNRLDAGLKFLVGKCVNVFYAGNVMFEQYYNNFDYSYMLNCKGAILLDLKDEDEEKSSITLKMDNIINFEIEDNSEEIEEGLMSEYHVENIYIEMQDFSKIRIELQW